MIYNQRRRHHRGRSRYLRNTGGAQTASPFAPRASGAGASRERVPTTPGCESPSSAPWGRRRFPCRSTSASAMWCCPRSPSSPTPPCSTSPAPHLAGYSRESSIAVKFQAVVKLGALNRPMNDFYDVWFLSRQFDPPGRKMAEGCLCHLRHPAHGSGFRSQPLLRQRSLPDRRRATRVEGLPCPQ